VESAVRGEGCAIIIFPLLPIKKGDVMRTSLLAFLVILLLGAYQLAHGETAKVTGGGSCTKLKHGSMGNFDINIVGEISPETADKVRKLFDERHAIYANARPEPASVIGDCCAGWQFAKEIPLEVL
jgi:hypothetical protein